MRCADDVPAAPRRHEASTRAQMDSTAQRRRGPHARRPAQGQLYSAHDRQRDSCDADRGIHDGLDARVCASDPSGDSRADSPRVVALAQFERKQRRDPRAHDWNRWLRIDRQGNGAARAGIRDDGAGVEARPRAAARPGMVSGGAGRSGRRYPRALLRSRATRVDPPRERLRVGHAAAQLDIRTNSSAREKSPP